MNWQNEKWRFFWLKPSTVAQHEAWWWHVMLCRCCLWRWRRDMNAIKTKFQEENDLLWFRRFVFQQGNVSNRNTSTQEWLKKHLRPVVVQYSSVQSGICGKTWKNAVHKEKNSWYRHFQMLLKLQKELLLNVDYLITFGHLWNWWLINIVGIFFFLYAATLDKASPQTGVTESMPLLGFIFDFLSTTVIRFP